MLDNPTKDVKKPPTTQPNLQPDNFSSIAMQDLLCECSPYAAITPLLTPDNAMYYAIQRTITKGTTVQLPYVVNNQVLRLNERYTRDISEQVLQSSPYTIIDGMCMTAMQMYNKVNVQHPTRLAAEFWRSRIYFTHHYVLPCLPVVTYALLQQALLYYRSCHCADTILTQLMPD